ncbi:MAG: prolyl oligopeptidase family serine peptidase [Candidatus Acidiferrum sp.]|jgi:dipeptidyl aminopeptidase/acylaminoacyl peptidase
MTKRGLLVLGFVLLIQVAVAQTPSPKPFTLEQVLSAPFAENLVAAKKANRVAWTLDEEGKRSIWVADGPTFQARRLTSSIEDDGQELSELSFSDDGNTIVYTRGGGKNSAGQSPNPTSNPAGATQTIWTLGFGGGDPRKIDAGHYARISSQGLVAYLRDGELYLASLGGGDKPVQLVVRGQNHSQRWSPDGSKLAFVSSRGDHGFIGVYDVASKSIRYLAPSVDTDNDPAWSLDGKRVAFVRRPAEPRDTPEGYFIEPDRPHPWAVWVADVDSNTAREIWRSSMQPQGSFPYMADDTGGGVLNWAADNRLVIASEEDGWQHLYSLLADGGPAKPLTPGECEVEQWSLSADRKTVFFNSNCGDIDRRHLWTIAVVGGAAGQLTRTQGVEWNPVVLANNNDFFYLGSDAQHASRVFRTSFSADGITASLTATPAEFPADQLVTPQQVIFRSVDGVEIHGQLFVPRGGKPGEKRPGLVFMHGGSMRQMLLGWHYMFYYSNSYAMNQYLASRGYVVLSVNYRSGIGYGRAFREAPGRAGRGATEYRDVVAAGKFLQARPDVDASRVGLWGGSYGGFLTAMGLAHNSDIFAAGVDFHGVHDWPTDNWDGKNIAPELTKLAHESSPVSAVDSWKSPVLFIHGDDDRNVFFTQTVDLVARLRTRGVTIEQLIFPDEIHDFLLHRHWLAGYQAEADFFDRYLKNRPPRGEATQSSQSPN